MKPFECIVEIALVILFGPSPLFLGINWPFLDTNDPTRGSEDVD
jgi:hypothetical protein